MLKPDQKIPFARVALSLTLLISSQSSVVYASSLESCRIAVSQSGDSNAATEEILNVQISYDTKKLGGGNEQIGVFEMLAKKEALLQAQKSVLQIINQQIRPAMVDILLGKTNGDAANQLIAELSTNLLIGEDLMTLANSQKLSEGGKVTEGSIEQLFQNLEEQKSDLMNLLNTQKNTLMSVATQAIPGAKLLKNLSEKFKKPKSVAEIAREAAKERDLQIDIAQRTVKLQQIANEMKDRLEKEIASVGEEGSSLLEAKMLVDGLLEYRAQLSQTASDPTFSGDAKNMARMEKVFQLIDSLISVSRQKVNDSININLQKQSTLQAIITLRSELQAAAAQYIAASKGAQATRVESVVAKQMGDGIKAMNEQHEEILERSSKDIKALTNTLKQTEKYRLEKHGSALAGQDALQDLVNQVQEMTLSSLEFNKSTAALIAHQVETQDLIQALAVPGNEETELALLEKLVNSPVNSAVLNGDIESLTEATVNPIKEKP